MNEKLLCNFSHFGKKINIVLIFPESYKFGIANLGHQTVFRILNESQSVNCERYYIDSSDSKFFSFETGRFLTDFDFIGFTSSYELDFFKITDLLKKLKLYPLDRRENIRKRPVIISGGAMTFINPYVLQEFSDIVVMGDFESIAEKFISILDSVKSGTPIKTIMEEYDFIFTPHLKVNAPNISEKIKAYSSIISESSQFPSTYLIELCRGCPYKCSFCSTGSTRGKLRFINRELFDSIVNMLISNNIKKVGLIGSAVLLYPDIEEMLKNFIDKGIMFSFSSLNISDINEKMLEFISKTNQQTLTLAPEVGSEKMQKIIGKKIDFDKLYTIVRYAASYGITRIKLYFLYGFEQEEKSDLEGIIKLVTAIKNYTCISGRPFNLIVSLNPVIPKPHTQMSAIKMQPKKVLSDKLSFLKNGLKSTGTRIESMSINEAVIQYSIANFQPNNPH
ncbi:radical SAM protein [Candidatus Dependentiae bacterium]|nr:radical SAM protein [Candidatus Dependentiae bacterium]